MISLGRQWASAVALGAVLLGLASWQAFTPVSLDLPEGLGSENKGVAKTPAESQPVPSGAPADYADVAKRPLFVAGRRPPDVAKAVAATAQVQALGAYAIVGIISAPDHAIAILHGQSGDTLHLRIGQAIEGWTLETIAPNKLIFVSGDQRQELAIKSDKNRQGPAGLRTNMGMRQPRAGLPPNNQGDPQ